MRDAAARTGVAASSFPKWERDPFGGGSRVVERLDRAYEQDGALVHVAAAARSALVLPADDHWAAHPPIGPIWGWFRSPHGATASVRWGPWALDVDVPPGRSGVVVTSPVSVPTPPLFVGFSGTGWFSTGPGRWPPWLDVPLVDGLRRLRPAARQSQVLDLVGRVVRGAQSSGRAGQALSRLAVQDSTVRSLLAYGLRRAQPYPPVDLPAAELGDRDLADARLARRARAALGLSLARAVDAANALGHPREDRVALHDLRRLESSGRVGDARAVSRFDVLYELDGRLVAGPVTPPGRDRLEIAFPAHWTGPVWISLRPVHGTHVRPATLRWAAYSKRLTLHSPALVETRRTPSVRAPLVVHAPGCEVHAGVGRRSGAADVNADWDTSPDSILRLLRDAIGQLARPLP